MGRSLSIAGAALLTATFASCSSPRAKELAEILQRVVSGKPMPTVSAAAWSDVGVFYEQNGGTPIWIDHRGKPTRANDALELLRLAPQHGLSSEDYGADDLQETIEAIRQGDTNAAERLREIATLDIRLTAALFTLGRDVALGRRGLSDIPGWKPRRPAPAFVATFNTALQERPAGWLDAIRPRHPEYAALQKALGDLLAQPEPDGSRVRQVALNLNRWRWMPDDLGERHFIVNIPQYEVVAREQGKEVLNIRAIVGTTENRTPIFDDEMETVVFSPYWNIPETIAGNETAPAIALDPDYLDKQGIDVMRVSGRRSEPVDSADIDFGDPAVVKDLVFRQRPGPRNALGSVKFVFPNSYNVYLHDTPSDRLFSRERRALSHGCIRVEEPERLAQYVLRDQSQWDQPRIAKAMASGVEQHVKLRQKLPVHIVYFTAIVDETGTLRFLPDIYSYDRFPAR